MGCGASVVRPSASPKKPSTPADRRPKVQPETPEVPTFMASLQGHMPNNHIQEGEHTKMIHNIELNDGLFPEKMPERIECDDTVEFQINGKDEYDIIQVYKDGNDYYRVNNGYELLHIKNRTPENQRRIILSLALNQPEIDLYFCVIPSSQSETILTTRKCPKINCEQNSLKVQKCEIKFSLTDEKESQKVYLHKGDTVDLEWVTKRGAGYRIEEKKYCPVSGGLYTVEQTPDHNISNRTSVRGKFSKTFNDFGMSFLFRLTDTNQVQDITVCIINETYKVKHVEITDKNIEPNLIWIEQSDWILFEWNTKRKQTIVQIHPFTVDEKKQQSVELKEHDEHFFWPHEPTRRGFMCHQFHETGIYCYKNGSNQIGTIIVEPPKTIYHIPILGEELIHKMNTKDLVQFDWKMTDSQEEPILITIDSNSSVVPHIANGLSGAFDCATHKCTKVEPFFRHHFHTCETFLLNISQHGLFNFTYTDKRDNNLISVIVENGIDRHRVVYNEDNTFEPNTLIINRTDQVWFDSSSAAIGSIYQTDEYGNRLESEQLLFQPQENSINYFMKDFSHEGIYYYSTDINSNNKKNKKDSIQPLAIIVIPDIHFHYRTVRHNDFDSHPIQTNVNDFVIWQFEHIISHNVIQLGSHVTLQDIIASHEQAVAGRNRQCLAVECIMPGTFFFANPEFERATGTELDRLVATIIVDPPFSQNCFVVANNQFVPKTLHIAQNETVSWALSSSERNHRIYIESTDNPQDIDAENFTDRHISTHIHDVHHLHTFHQAGEYTIKSGRFQTVATVFVHLESAIRSQKRRVQEPQIVEDIDILSPFGTQIHLVCPNRYASIYYTLDGSLPTRQFDNVQEYDQDTGVIFVESGLHLIRAYAKEEQRLPSSIITSSLTFVMESKELAVINERRGLWNSSKITFSASLQQPNKLFGSIEVEPTSSIDLIDYFELYVNNIALKKTLSPKDLQFSADGFAGGEQYEIYVVAYLKDNIIDAEPLSSNKREFEIKREVQGGGPLVSLSLSDDQLTLFLMWAHIGDHVSEYIIYVDNIETKIITEKEFSNFYGIQFHGAQQHRKYLLHVEAKMKNNNEIRKSNVIPISLPIEIPTRERITGRHFPYVTINGESTPSDTHLETLQHDPLSNRRPEADRKTEVLPITNGFRNAVPTISYKRNPNGVTLFWTTKSDALADSVKNYRIVVDNEPYGKLIGPRDDTKYHLNLSPGRHECYLDIIPNDENEEIFKSNILTIEIQSTGGLKSERRQQKEPSDTPIHEVLEQQDIPVPKLNIQTINPSSIRANWYSDRPMPADAFVAFYEVHVRGQDFPEQMTSSEQWQEDGYIEHVWHASNSPLEITGILEGHEYTVFVRALVHFQGLKDINYIKITSNEVTTTRVDPHTDLLSRPLLKVTRLGLQMANLSWKLDDSVDQTLVKGYRIILNSKPTEILPPDQHEYELRHLKLGTTNEIQVSVTSNPDFVDEKVSEPIRIVCPQRPQPPIIQLTQVDKPFSIGIKWQIDRNDQDEISSFKIFLNGKLHEEIETNGRQSFKYYFNKLQAEQTYSIYIKVVIEQKKLEGYTYQCGIESKASNELSSRSAVPPKGTMPRIERMHPNGIEIVWDAPEEYGDVKITGYQILQDGRAIGKRIALDQRQASIKDLEIGNRYSFQVVPITDQPGGTLFRTGDEYNSDRHGHYIPGPKLEVEYTDLIQLPTKFWIENISGHSAMVCWSPIDESSSTNIQPEGYKLLVWDNKELTRDKPIITPVTKDKTNAHLKDLQPNTTYEIELEAYKKRRHQATNDVYIVSSISEILTFHTGSPPDPPANLYLIACTNTDARFGFDPFVEHNAEIKTIRVQCEPVSSQINTKEISLELTPDSTDFILSNLIERTDYNVTIYGITEEYLNENHCRDAAQLPKKFKPSEWLPNQSLQFKTSGYEPVENLNIRKATTESVQLDWKLPKVYGSTQYITQILRWKLEHGGDEQSRELDRSVTNTTIPGTLPSGLYKISLDSIFSVKINLVDDTDETSRKEIRLTTTKSVAVRFRAPASCERPEIYLMGYTTNTIDLTWNKPDMFSILDHPEKNNEQLKIHRRLIGYRVDVNGRKHNTLDEDQYRCTLTECQPGEKYEVQVIARTTVQNEYINNMIMNDKENVEEPDETPSRSLRVRMLKSQDLLRSFQTNFEFNHNEPNENTTTQQNEIKSSGKLNVNWTVSDTKNISHFILQWRSSKDLQIQQKTIAANETSATIDSCDEKYYYTIEIIVVTNDGGRSEYEQLTVPIPGKPDPPKLWLVKTTDTSFTVEWSEPKSYGIPVIGFQLYIEGKKTGDIIEVNLRRAEIPSRINRTYQVNVCARTNNPLRLHSMMSQTLSVITTPTTNLIPTIYYTDDDRNIARIIPLQIESVNEERLHLDWTSFLPTAAIRAYYIHYTCLNNGDVQTMKVSKRFRQTVLRGLRPGFTYGIMIMAADKNGGVLYTSDKSTVQMNAPPNAPIVVISDRKNTHVKLEWRPAASYGEVTVVGYKIFVNNRLAAILPRDQLTYTLTHGIPCDTYTVHVQALSSEKNIVSPMSRGVQFAWPGIKPGAFKRIDDGQTGTITVAWEHPRLEDETEKLVAYKLLSENLATHSIRLHGDYDAATQQATIHDLNNGRYRLWLEIRGEKHTTRARPIMIMSGRFNSLLHRQASLDSAKCYNKRQKRFQSPPTVLITSTFRHTQYS